MTGSDPLIVSGTRLLWAGHAAAANGAALSCSHLFFCWRVEASDARSATRVTSATKRRRCACRQGVPVGTDAAAQ